jgi:monomeric isocitrate dehydrogenase
MTDARLVVPAAQPGEVIKGPRSYFASIEKTYGRPIQEWVDLAAERLESGSTHMEAVGWLKSDHAMGHGHANAVVAWVKAKLAS